MVIAPLEENISLQEATTSDNNLSVRPTILVFDSGVGGLSVYREVKKMIPNAHYIYAFDNEAFPYGEKSEEFIIDRVYQIVNAIAAKHPLTIAIIACNTASTVSLPNLRAHFTFPVVGVVPAIKPATKLTRNGVVGLLATKGTVNREYTKELIERFATDCKVISLGSAELVQLAERKLHGETLPLDEVAQTVRPWIRMPEPPDTVILGCTHFPLLIEELEKVLPNGTRFIDSGSAIARRTVWLINNQEEIANSEEENFAYCLLMDDNAKGLQPVLEAEGFKTLEKLAI
ncbi:glutamate racemase [Providencia rettgeri]|uniref:Glutamate racemase n=1 Tax=Providencia hangzhouensis TaxID=3031799 RepID=A0ABY9Z8S3_9GAMM|nr:MULTISPECIES: glutamate racemase [Providencia]EFE51575.1 glutamate racemase [Providencia rettgeri DSM 1131]EHZ6873393.1 glutamate racemase [Providencia rettgeri]MBI6191668.1 glutamate racemase [Providencia rettgeri]MCG9528463.1 glutamate racemase [Providencia rettgeri]MCL0013097.1 glutamate racemase [Providencia rettgeri]